MIIDTHCHLDDEKFKNNIDEVVKNATLNGVKKIIIPGANIDDLNRAFSICQKYKNIFYAIGVHPYNKEQYDEDKLLKYSNDKKCVGVGECGLDYFRLPKNKEELEKLKCEQKKVFISHIALAKKLNKPLIVHIRDENENFDASNDAKDILKQYGTNINDNNQNTLRGVLHCFNACNDLLELSKWGFYFSIGGILTFKNAKKLQNIINKIPKEKLLLETDAPYLTPHPFRGKCNEPKYTSLVANKMSELLNVSINEIHTLTTKNAYRLFDINRQ